jgi:hypothetical protein
MLAKNVCLKSLDLSGGKQEHERTVDSEFAKSFAVGLQVNVVLSELSIADSTLCPTGALHLGQAITNRNASLTRLTFSGAVRTYLGWQEGRTLTLAAGLVEAQFSNKKLGVPGTILISAWLASGADSSSLTSLDIGLNRIPADEMVKVLQMAYDMPSLRLLCTVPFKDTTVTHLDVSRKKLGPEGAIVVARYLKGNKTLTKLNLSFNEIGGWQGEEGVCALAEALRRNHVLEYLDVSTNRLDGECTKLLASAIHSSASLATLKIDGNPRMSEEDLPRCWTAVHTATGGTAYVRKPGHSSLLHSGSMLTGLVLKSIRGRNGQRRWRGWNEVISRTASVLPWFGNTVASPAACRRPSSAS